MTESYQIAGREMEAPIINGAGSISGINIAEMLEHARTLAASPIGGIKIGSFTLEPSVGNEAQYGYPVYYHNSNRGETYNSMGLPNVGIEEAIRIIPEFKAIAQQNNKPLIVSVSPSSIGRESLESIDQIEAMTTPLINIGVDLIVINTSCPNIVVAKGDRKPIMGYDGESMYDLLEMLERVYGREAGIGLKLPPYMTTEQQSMIPGLAQYILHCEAVEFIITANTIPNQVPRDETGNNILSVPNGMGGMSGPATSGIGREQLELWLNHLHSKKDVVSMLGINSGKELAWRVNRGASAGGGVTFLWESDDWGSAVTNMLEEYIQYEE
jgi:dihydroorotate dehydrogenase